MAEFNSIFTPEEDYFLVYNSNTRKFAAYRPQEDGTLIDMTSTAFPETGAGSHCYNSAISPNGVYLAALTDSSPFFIWWKRDGDVFTKMPLPDITPTDNTTESYGYSEPLCWSPDNNYLICGNDTEKMIVYRRIADTLVKIEPIPVDILPTYCPSKIFFSPSGQYLFHLGKGTSVSTYLVNGENYSKVTNRFTIGADTIAYKYSPDKKYLAFTQTTSPYLRILKVNEDESFTEITGFGTCGVSEYLATRNICFSNTGYPQE